MEPIAYGFLSMVAGTAVMGVLIGAVCAAIVWRVRGNIVYGALITSGVFLLLMIIDDRGRFTWFGAEVYWGAPALAVGYLLCSASARWLEALTRLGRTWTALAALVFTLAVGFFYLRLFNVDPKLLVPVGWWAGLVLVVLVILSRWRRAVPAPGAESAGGS